MDFEVEDEEVREKKKKSKNNQKLMIGASIFFLVLAIILTLVYLATPKKQKTTVAPQQTTVVEEPKEITIVKEDSNDRPLAVMIDNNIGDAKHAGLLDSYVNYEIIVEGGLTRIMAIFKDRQVGVIGPVRSARHYFLDYALEHDAIYAHFGWSPSAEDNIKELNVQNINGMVDTSGFARDKNLPSPHNVFTTTNKLKNVAETKGYLTTSNSWKVFEYSTDEIELNKNEKGEAVEKSNLQTASRISIDYSATENRSYNYDSVNQYYLRSTNGKAHIDRRTDGQLHYKNIIIMKVENKTMDDEGRQDLITVGSGSGFFITNGYSLPINWAKSARNAKTIYTYADGTPLKLNDGNTFIQIVPISSNIVIE